MKGRCKMNQIPEFLINKLINQYGDELTKEIIKGYENKRKTTLRINTLKSSLDEVLEVFSKEGIKYSQVDFFKQALICENKTNMICLA